MAVHAIQLAAELLEEQQKNWQRGERVLVEHHLQANPLLAAERTLVCGLIENEIALRRNAGEQPAGAEYHRRFPGYSEWLQSVLPPDEPTSAPRDTDGRVETSVPAGGPSAVAPPTSPGHGRLGPYELQALLGQGGMGQVWRGKHVLSQQVRAVKVMHAGSVAQAAERKRFVREIRLLSDLKHENIVTAYDAGEDGGALYLVMELIAGKSLAQLVREGGPLPVSLAANYVWQAARGLGYAHQRPQQVVHRDIKPGNLMLDQRQIVKVLDLGLARCAELTAAGGEPLSLTGAGAVLGTLGFMSPEHVSDTKRVDVRSDIYSLGCTFYFLLTGRAPFQAQNLNDFFFAHMRADVPALHEVRADVADALVRVFEKMLAKSPADRFQSMEEAAAALERAALESVRQGTGRRPALEQNGPWGYMHGGADGGPTPEELEHLLWGKRR